MYTAANDIAAVVADLSVQVTDGDVADARGATAPLDRAGRWQRNALAIAAAIVGLAGGLVVVQALARHLAGRPKDPDVLAAIGVTPRERSVAGVLSVIPAIIGGIAGGVVVAVGVSPLLPLGVIRRADPDIGVHADAGTLVLGSLAALVIMIGAASLAATHWATPSPAGTMKRTPSIATRLAADVGLRPVPATGAQFALAPDRDEPVCPWCRRCSSSPAPSPSWPVPLWFGGAWTDWWLAVIASGRDMTCVSALDRPAIGRRVPAGWPPIPVYETSPSADRGR